jgi:hypothetical protein
MSLDLLPFIAAAAPQGDYLHVQSAFDPQNLFSAVPALAAQFRPYFVLLAFVIVGASVGTRILRHQGDIAMAWAPSLIYALFIVIIPVGLNSIDGAVLDLVQQSGMTDPTAIFSKMTGLSDPFRPNDAGELRNQQQLQADAHNPAALAKDLQNQGMVWGMDLSGWNNFWSVVAGNAQKTSADIKASLDFAKDPLGTIGNTIRYVFFKVLAIFGAFLIWLILQCCGIVIYVFLSVRFLLVHLESIVLPVFVAMIATDSLRGTGNNFVLGIVGIIFWPLGWALGHIGTLALANWFSSLVALTLHVPGTSAPGAIYDMIVNGPLAGQPLPMPQALAAAVGITFFGALVIGIYVLVVTFSAPFIIAKALKSGSGMYGEMVGGAAKGAAGLGAAAAGLAALAMSGGSAAATAGAGGSAQAAAGGTGGGAAVGGMPVGVDAPAALGHGSSLTRAGGGIGGGGAGSRSLASRATMRAPAGSGGIYAPGGSGDVAYIPMAQDEMAAAFSGGAGGSSGGGGGGGGNGGGGSSGGAGGSSSGGGGSSGGSGGGGKAGGGKSAKVSGSSARAYRRVMAMGALQGVLGAASQWDGGADLVSHAASRASSDATNQYDRSRRLDRQDFDGKQEDDDKA